MSAESVKAHLLPATCRTCGTTISRRNNLRTHVKSQHPSLAHLPLSELATPDSAFPAQRARRGRRPPRPGTDLVPVPAAAEEVPGLGVEDVDQIVVAVVGQVAPSGMIPVAHLAALFAWREATAVFLREVSRP